MNLNDITSELAKPFDPSEIDFLPKSQFEKNGRTMCIGLPFADPRTYQDRLNILAPGEWQSSATIIVAGNKIVAVVTITICGISHADVGEANIGENTATEAHAQAFKRACSQFGLGRYLYDLEKQYLPYDKQKKRFDLSDADLLDAVKQMYRKSGLLPGEQRPAPTRTSEQSNPTPQINPEVRRLKALASELGLVKDTASWMAYKKSILGHEVMDRDLAPAQITRINNDLDAKKKAAKPAETAKV